MMIKPYLQSLRHTLTNYWHRITGVPYSQYIKHALVTGTNNATLIISWVIIVLSMSVAGWLIIDVLYVLDHWPAAALRITIAVILIAVGIGVDAYTTRSAPPNDHPPPGGHPKT